MGEKSIVPEESDEGHLVRAYTNWRQRHDQGWGLAWYLAAELVERFYVSHGVRAVVIYHDGLGYYGIGLHLPPCSVRKRHKKLGRFTMSGDVENWVTGGPGDHGLKLTERAKTEPASKLLSEAITHLRLAATPSRSHIPCRHHRWGPSAVLIFQLSALLALRHDTRVSIYNGQLAQRAGKDLDPKADQREHPGWTRVIAGDREVIMVNDGRVLEPAGARSLWQRFMAGESRDALASWLEDQLGLRLQNVRD